MAKNMNAKKSAALAATLLFSCCAYAVDFLEAAPGQTRLILENDKVRVIEANLMKGDKVPMHTHPDIVLYIIKAGKTRFTDAEGKTTESKSAEGSVSFRPATAHSHEHLEDSRALVIELKE